MKKSFWVLTVVLIAFSLLSGVTAFAENQYVKNGDFETGDFTGWVDKVVPDGTVCEIRQDSTGNHYLYMQSDSELTRVTNRVGTRLQPRDAVTLSFDLKIDDLAEGSSALVNVAYKDENNVTIEKKTSLNYYEYRGEWKHYEFDLQLPENAHGIAFGLRLTGAGQISWDNLKLTNENNKTELKVTYGGLELDRIPDGVSTVTARMHYASQTGDTESGNLLFAAYSKGEDGQQKLAGLKITPYTTSSETGSIYLETDISLPDNAEDISVKAYIWKNGATPQPIADSKLLPKEGRSPIYDRFVTERMRGAYGSLITFFKDEDGDGKREVMERLLDAGVNTLIFLPDNSKDFARLEQRISEVEKFAKERNIMVFIKFNYGTSAVVGSTAFGAYHPGMVHERSAPCPLSTEYWNRSMFDRFEIVARHPGITGGVFDFEMYGVGGTRYTEPCLCDTCVAHYASDYPSEVANQLVQTTAENRLEFVKVNNILTTYDEWQKEEVTKITADIRTRLQAINPNFICGVMPNHSWFPGVDQGLGTEKMPLMVFGENYAADLKRARKAVTEMETNNIHGVFTKGLGPKESYIPLDEFAARLSEAGMINGGYWMYEIPMLEEDYAAKQGVTGATTYYDELKKGNQQLDAILGLD